jgi:hypothetical protein
MATEAARLKSKDPQIGKAKTVLTPTGLLMEGVESQIEYILWSHAKYFVATSSLKLKNGGTYCRGGVMRYAAALILGLGLLMCGCVSRDEVLRVTSPGARLCVMTHTTTWASDRLLAFPVQRR